jgi:LCP family protein required for cell wall assembly
MSGLPVTTAVPPPGNPGPPTRPKKRRWPKIVLTIAVALAVLAVLAGVGAYVLMQKVGQITVIGVPGTEAAPTDNEPVNILLMGSDDRTGKGNKGYGWDSGRTTSRSDTTILLHISADRSRALALSIPRDLWVEQPDCTGKDWAGSYAKFNNAFEQGGAACTSELVQEVTGLPVDHVVVVDFNGFKQMVDAMGGVEVCLEHPVDDIEAKLKLPAGTSVVGRIQRQQAFLSAAIRKATDSQLLLNPARVYEMIDVATRSLTVSSGLDGLGPMRTMAESVRAVKPSNITFVTLPFTYRSDLANVDLDAAAAKPIIEAMRNDTPYPPPATVDQDGNKLTVAPEDISVRVVDSSGGRVSMNAVQAELSDAGFQVSEVTSGPRIPATKVVHPRNQTESARTLAYATDSVSVADNQMWMVTLEVGRDWAGVKDDIVVAKPKGDGNTTASPTSADRVVCAS